MIVSSRGDGTPESGRHDEANPGPEFDPDDPDVVKVHYDVSGWDIEHRAELTAALAEAGLEHRWVEHEVVVPEAIEGAVDAVFEDLEARFGPFPVLLADDAPAVQLQLDDLGAEQVEAVRRVLVEAGIAHRLEGVMLEVHAEMADDVDELLEALERGDLAWADEESTAPADALGRLFSIADRLRRDDADRTARRELAELVGSLDARNGPFGVAARSWALIVESTAALSASLDSDGYEPEAVNAAADELKSLTRPFV